jgi:hypothetical protein
MAGYIVVKATPDVWGRLSLNNPVTCLGSFWGTLFLFQLSKTGKRDLALDPLLLRDPTICPIRDGDAMFECLHRHPLSGGQRDHFIEADTALRSLVFSPLAHDTPPIRVTIN